LEPSQTNGFVIDEAEITFWGLCPRCRDDSTDLDPDEPRQPRSRAMSHQKESPREEKDRHV
jgi:hypothetical protein